MIVRQPNGLYLITRAREFRPIHINLYELQVKQYFMDNAVGYAHGDDTELIQDIIKARMAKAGVWWDYILSYEKKYGVAAARMLARKVGDIEYAESVQVSA